MNKKVDYIIVGQGLAGSILAMELLKRDQSILVFDLYKENSASNVAIGLVNPITGKRLVKSWLIDDLIPKSISTYQELERKFSSSFIRFSDIARVIPNDDIFNQWKPNFDKAVEEGYISSQLGCYSSENRELPYFTIQKSFYLRTASLLSSIRTYLGSIHSLVEKSFNYSSIENHEDKVIYDGVECKKIIFCEGANGRFNPYFEELPWNVNKGEVIDIEHNQYRFNKILKKNVFLVNEETHCRVGATYDREHIDELPTQKALDYFSNRLEPILSSNYKTIKHQAAIRPATRDRRPFLGQSKKNKNSLIFNGFGAKGVSLIPYFSEQFSDYLQIGTSIHPEANINRFS